MVSLSTTQARVQREGKAKIKSKADDDVISIALFDNRRARFGRCSWHRLGFHLRRNELRHVARNGFLSIHILSIYGLVLPGLAS